MIWILYCRRFIEIKDAGIRPKRSVSIAVLRPPLSLCTMNVNASTAGNFFLNKQLVRDGPSLPWKYLSSIDCVLVFHQN